MLGLFYTLVAALTLNFCVEAQGEFRCPSDSENSRYPNPQDCGSFFKCSNGTPYLFECPPPLHYSKETDRCDWPEVANCQPSDSGGDNGSGNGGDNTRLQRRSNYEELVKKCFGGMVVGYRRDPDRCECYYQCDHRKGDSRSYHACCEQGTRIDTRTNTCEWAQSSKCDGEFCHLDSRYCCVNVISGIGKSCEKSKDGKCKYGRVKACCTASVLGLLNLKCNKL